MAAVAEHATKTAATMVSFFMLTFLMNEELFARLHWKFKPPAFV
jgi:hypothetical protein